MLSHQLQILPTLHLGKYLGCLIHHDRPNANSFNFLIEKIQNKLTGWRAKLLSPAGRTTFIKSVNVAIPSYIMQNNFLPKKTIQTIDKLNRDFLWGLTLEKRKLHAVNWENVSKPKTLGGLGIRQTLLVNQVCMGNLNWRLANDNQSL
ncbi:hypothetical protein ACSBR1_001003 [Camellia fascicularis]